MSVASPVRAYTQPLDQQDGSPLLHLPSPMFPERKPGAVLAEGLRMSPKKLSDSKPSDDQSPGAPVAGSPFGHLPVMLEEVIDMFAGVPEGVVLDATVGGGGHALALLNAFPHLRVVGLDQDGEAVAAATSVLLSLIHIFVAISCSPRGPRRSSKNWLRPRLLTVPTVTPSSRWDGCSRNCASACSPSRSGHGRL